MSDLGEVKGWAERWAAPAKLNLLLKITGRRSDGYHLLQSVFQIIDLCDWFRFYPLHERVVRLKNTIPGVPLEDDLVYRAAKLLQDETGTSLGVLIESEKNLPMGGGLGGGSSDAATVLVALNHLWQLGLSRDRLMELGLRLGADVPIFVFGYSAWAEGVGERLQKLILPEAWFVIIKPDCHVNTRQIFLSEELTRNSKPITINDFTEGHVVNDCLSVVSKLYPPVSRALDELNKFGHARLTGTGACVFAQYSEEAQARSVARQLSGCGDVFVAKGLNQSPAYEMLEQL